MDAPTVSWLLVKFSRFHSSQQCNERKTVCNAIIANFSAVWRKNLHCRIFSPALPFVKYFMPSQKQILCQCDISHSSGSMSLKFLPLVKIRSDYAYCTSAKKTPAQASASSMALWLLTPSMPRASIRYSSL